MLKAIVLICATSIDPSACTPATALDIVRLPPVRGTMCGMGAMTSLAELELKAGRYPKVVCAR